MKDDADMYLKNILICFVIFSRGLVSSYPVKLNPPINVTVQMGSDSNLWYYWNQTAYNCVENEVRIRTNGKKWDVSEKQKHPSIMKRLV